MDRRNVITTILLTVTLTAAAAPGYTFSLSQMLGSDEEQNLNTFKLIHVADLKALLDRRGEKVRLYDANSDVTRARLGTIAGATLLDSDANYPLSVLPSNKQTMLVFYCADRH